MNFYMKEFLLKMMIRKIYTIVILFDYDSIKILMNYLVAGAALPVELLYS